MAAGLVGFGVAATLPKFIPHHLERQEYASIRRLIVRGFSVLLVAGLLVYAALLLLLPVVEQHWPALSGYRRAVILMGVMVPLGLLIFFLQQGLRGFHEIRYMVMGSSFLQLTAKVLLTVVVFAAGMRLSGYVFAVVASTLLAFLWMAAGLVAKFREMPANAIVGCPRRAPRSRRGATMRACNSLARWSGSARAIWTGFCWRSSPAPVRSACWRSSSNCSNCRRSSCRCSSRWPHQCFPRRTRATTTVDASTFTVSPPTGSSRPRRRC